MSIAEKFEIIADAVYEKGKDYIWEVVQLSGARINYSKAFLRWRMDGNLHPKYKVIPTEVASGHQTFYRLAGVSKIESKYFDFSRKPRGTSSSNGWYYTFNGCNVKEIEDIGMKADCAYTHTFAFCKYLCTIALIRTDEKTSWDNTFQSCTSLENITIEGVIGRSGFDVKDCKKLTVDSLLSILTALSKDSNIASGKSITFSTVHQSVIEGNAECLEQLNLAVNAGWTIAYA